MDEEERRFIGDLLSGDDDVFHSTPVGGGTPSQTGLPPSAAPIGAPPHGMNSYWPEPPPPYSPPLQQWPFQQAKASKTNVVLSVAVTS